MPQELDSSTIENVLSSLHLATQTAPEWGKAWHHWALFNVQAIDHFAHSDIHLAQRHVAPAVHGFFRSVALGQAKGERPGLETCILGRADAKRGETGWSGATGLASLCSNHQVHFPLVDGAGEALKGANLQDILRLLTLWFNHGNSPEVEAALKEGFGRVSIDTWLVVIPQVSQEPYIRGH